MGTIIIVNRVEAKSPKIRASPGPDAPILHSVPSNENDASTGGEMSKGCHK
jgi:hypothetical protein